MAECKISQIKPPPTRILQETIYETFKVFRISLYIYILRSKFIIYLKLYQGQHAPTFNFQIKKKHYF